VQGQQVSVEHLGQRLPALVIWEYVDTGRLRALIRFETAAGLVVRQPFWVDELYPDGRVIELPLVTAGAGRPCRRLASTFDSAGAAS
jgi:hypothetical protein